MKKPARTLLRRARRLAEEDVFVFLCGRGRCTLQQRRQDDLYATIPFVGESCRSSSSGIIIIILITAVIESIQNKHTKVRVRDK